MKLRRRSRSANVEDRRGQAPGGGFRGLGGGGFPIPIGKGGGIGVLVLAIALAVCIPRLLGEDGGLSGDVFSGFGQAPPPGSGELDPAADPDAKLFGFVNAVVDDVQVTWTDVFRDAGKDYREAVLVVFEGRTGSACGPASSTTGPFYCPPDEQIYLDLDFFRELRNRFGAPGDFAQAYVIAHEFGHHVQKLLGIDGQVQRRSAEDPSQSDDLSIRLELQADCLAGVWGHSTFERGILESGDLGEGLAAAAAVGDDRIQEATTGRIDPESFTHGSAEQRARWFRVGFDSGDPNACDTFSADI